MADMFLKLTDVEGESLDEHHLDEIEIQDWTWRVYNNAPLKLHNEDTSFGSFDHITIHKMIDAASTTLMTHCAYGQHIKKGIITCRKNFGDKKFEFLKIELNNVKVQDVNWAEGRGANNVHTEHVNLSFASVKVEYKKQVVPPAGAKPGDPPPAAPVVGPKEFHFETQDKAEPAKPGR